MGAVWYISGQKKTTTKSPTSLKIWINEWTTDSYKTLIDGFKKYAPEYSKTDIIIEKQTSDADRYRTLLLSTLSDGSGPDIMMLHSGEDAILDTKIEPIPGDRIDVVRFDKEYDDIFQWLLTSTGSGKDKEIKLKWVPLAYETLGVFYNKALLREVPKTWNDLENLYRSTSPDVFPSNLWLGPTYTPNMIDILPLWLNQADVRTYSDMASSKNGLSDYLSYATIDISWGQSSDSESNFASKNTLQSKKSDLLSKKISTLDMFMRGDIAMIIGYPSLILDLEKSSKRVSSDGKAIVLLTERIPQSSPSRTNIGRYSYFAISKLTERGDASVKFLEYLMTTEAERLYMSEYPYLIPAQSEFYTTIESQSLSDNYIRTRLWAFVPALGEEVTVFDYGLKSRFERYLREWLDQTDTPDIDSTTTQISREIGCEIASSIGISTTVDCPTTP